MNKPEWNKLEWWYWLVADGLLLLALLVDRNIFYSAIAFNVLQWAHIALRRQGLTHFSSQVRFAYVLWMAAGLLPGLFWMHWIQLMGTTALLVVDYCPLARLLSLLPWNRQLPLSWRLVVRTILAPPRRGPIQANPYLAG